MKILLGLFIIAHGLLHASYLTPKPDDPNYPFDFGKGWFAAVAGAAAPTVGTVLVIATVVCFLLGGLGIIGVSGLAGIWKPLMITGAVSSLALLVLFWHPWLILGLVIDAAILYAKLTRGWQLN